MVEVGFWMLVWMLAQAGAVVLLLRGGLDASRRRGNR